MSRSNMKGIRNVNLSVLPGSPTDGSGQMCIHLFIESNDGAMVEPHVLTPEIKDGSETKELTTKSARGGIACDIKRPSHKVSGSTVSLTMRTDDPRAVTCPKCKETPIFKTMIQRNQH